MGVRSTNASLSYCLIVCGHFSPLLSGKTTMANLVAKIMLKMKLLTSDKVVFVNNSLELIGSYVGQTPAKVDAKVAEAKGGCIFIDEAYSIVKGGGERDSNGGQFGREAIDTIMKHMDPPTCVFIFAGYEKPMEVSISRQAASEGQSASHLLNSVPVLVSSAACRIFFA